MSASDDIEDFAEKLRLVLQATGLGRTRLPQLAGIDKSVASRWLGGRVRPSEASLDRLTESIRRVRPEFGRADWHLPLARFGARVGVVADAPMATPLPSPPTLPNPWAQPGNELAMSEASYAGLWLFFYASMQAQPRITLCTVEMFREGETLQMMVGHAGIWRGHGPVFCRGAKLFLSADDRLRNSAIALWAMWGVQQGKALVLDGFNMTQANDQLGALAATRSIALRIADPIEAARREARFERVVEHVARLGTLEIGRMLPGPIQAAFRQPPPVEGLPCVHRVTVDRSFAISAEALEWNEDPGGPRRLALARLRDAFAAVLAEAEAA